MNARPRPLTPEGQGSPLDSYGCASLNRRVYIKQHAYMVYFIKYIYAQSSSFWPRSPLLNSSGPARQVQPSVNSCPLSGTLLVRKDVKDEDVTPNALIHLFL